ncbi:MAG: hypothetical protein U5K28_01130 [Halobacteriales archaeon]|nr:hypothetical protein [Halobacteriales archaeon]
MRRFPTALLALLFVPLLVLTASAGVAAPPPVDVCGVCGLADDEGYPPDQPEATILDSSLTVTVHDDGTTTWVETATVSEETADRLRTDERYRQRVTQSTRIVTRPQNLTATLNGQQVTITYGGQTPAERRIGGIRVFDFDQSSYRPSIGAYRVAVRGPDGTVAHRVPGNGEQIDGDAVWPASVTDGFGRTAVVFAPSGPVGAVFAHTVGTSRRAVGGVVLVVAVLIVSRYRRE